MAIGLGNSFFIQYWECPRDRNNQFCSGRGECIAQDTCDCTPGTIGPSCEYFICFQRPSNDPMVCSSHGNCTNVDTCDCRLGWFGEKCHLTTCYGYDSNDTLACSTHGDCVGPDRCECPYPWIGRDCVYTLVPLFVIPAIFIIASAFLVILTLIATLTYYVMNSNHAMIEIEKLKEKIRNPELQTTKSLLSKKDVDPSPAGSINEK
jgi:hypothetical protein